MPATSHTPEQPVMAVTTLSSSSDQAQLGPFKSKLSSAGLYQPASGDTPASHDDSTLLCVTVFSLCV
jgi:hypothetical protein